MFDGLKEDDYFGCIVLNQSLESDSIILEQKAQNQHIKQRFIHKLSRAQNNIVKVKRKADARATTKDVEEEIRKRRLEKALFLALDWQRTLVDEHQVIINKNNYYGPHKWIICLLGQGNYFVKQFLNDKGEYLCKQDYLSISVLGLSDSRFTENEATVMQELTNSTVEGVFANVTSRFERGEELAKKFLAHMDVYPSEPLPSLKETFTAK